MSPLRLLSITIAVLFCAPFAQAEVHFFDSRTWLRARTINPGQQVWSVQSSYQKISDRFTAGGKSQALGQPYRRAVTWRQLLESEKTVAGKAEMQDFMSARGIRDGDVAATASYDVSREEVGFHMNWAYGLMRRWMIGFNVPLVYRKTEARSRVEVSPHLSNSPRVKQASGGIKQKVREISEEQLRNSGYDQIPDQRSSWDWGDISLLSQISLLQNFNWQWSLQQVVRFPTARNPNLDEYIQMSDDSGQVDVGATSMIDFKTRRWTLGSRLGYVAQLPDTVRTRISDENNFRQVDPKVSRDLGDWWWVSGDIEFKYSRRVDLNLEHAYLNKIKDKYRGVSSTGVNYADFARNTDQEVHQTRIGLQYLLYNNGIRGGIEEKWVASLGYNYPWIGRNSLNASRATVDIMSYF